MARFLVQRDGLFLGSSSAVNLVACVKLARKMGWSKGEKIVTVLCVFPPCYPTLHSPVANNVVEPFFFGGAARARQFNLIGVTQALDITPRFVLLPFELGQC